MKEKEFGRWRGSGVEEKSKDEEQKRMKWEEEEGKEE